VKISLNLEIKFRKSVRKSNSKSNSNSKSGPNSIEFGSKVCSSMDSSSSSSSRRNSSSSSCYVSSKLEVNNLTLYNKTTISSGEIDINLVPRQLKLTQILAIKG